ncbi:hypothetical protein AB1Y20_008195 [Prymnesium parvum]|uniref:Uncharacterized protein n=1 Tax=Prymnesium parvum TaxID=97485 RepID=A0AB34IW68_PRYPA
MGGRVERARLLEYYEQHVMQHVRHLGRCKLQRATVILQGESDRIDVSSLMDKCADYVSMQLKKAIFEVSNSTDKEVADADVEIQEASDGEHREQANDERDDDDLDHDGPSGDNKRTSAPQEPTTNAKQHKKQKTLGFFFGNVLRKEYGRDDAERFQRLNLTGKPNRQPLTTGQP